MPKTAIAFNEGNTDTQALHVRPVFPVQAAYTCQPLPLVNGPTISEYYRLIRLPATISSPTWPFGSTYLDACSIPLQAREPQTGYFVPCIDFPRL